MTRNKCTGFSSECIPTLKQIGIDKVVLLSKEPLCERELTQFYSLVKHKHPRKVNRHSSKWKKGPIYKQAYDCYLPWGYTFLVETTPTKRCPDASPIRITLPGVSEERANGSKKTIEAEFGDRIVAAQQHFDGVSFKVSEVEVALDYEAPDDRFIFNRIVETIGVRPSKADNNPKLETYYQGKRRSGKSCKNYPRIGTDLHRLEFAFRQPVLGREGIVFSEDIISADWSTILQKHFRFIKIEWDKIYSRLKKVYPDPDKQIDFMKDIYDEEYLLGLKKEFQEITGIRMDRKRHLVEHEFNSFLWNSLFVQWERWRTTPINDSRQDE